MTREFLEKMINDCGSNFTQIKDENKKAIREHTFGNHYVFWDDNSIDLLSYLMCCFDMLTFTDNNDLITNLGFIIECIEDGKDIRGYIKPQYVNWHSGIYINRNFDLDNKRPKYSEITEWHGFIENNPRYFERPELIVIKYGNDILFGGYSIANSTRKYIQNLNIINPQVLPEIIERCIVFSETADYTTDSIYYHCEEDLIYRNKDMWNKNTLKDLFKESSHKNLNWVNPKYNENKPDWREIKLYVGLCGNTIFVYKFKDDIVAILLRKS